MLTHMHADMHENSLIQNLITLQCLKSEKLALKNLITHMFMLPRVSVGHIPTWATQGSSTHAIDSSQLIKSIISQSDVLHPNLSVSVFPVRTCVVPSCPWTAFDLNLVVGICVQECPWLLISISFCYTVWIIRVTALKCSWLQYDQLPFSHNWPCHPFSFLFYWLLFLSLWHITVFWQPVVLTF